MGISKTYRCTKCDYQYFGSAGDGQGFVAVVRTYSCLNCHKLSDLLVGKYGMIDYNLIYGMTKTGAKAKRKKLKCEECKSVDVIVWDSENKPCPVKDCTGTLVEDPNGEAILWD